MSTKPIEPPPEDEPNSLEKLAEFTRRILQVPRNELPDKRPSTGPIPTEEPCPET